MKGSSHAAKSTLVRLNNNQNEQGAYSMKTYFGRLLICVIALAACNLPPQSTQAKWSSLPPSAAPALFDKTDVRTDGFKDAKISNLSTFSIDVDTASYTIARSYLQNGSLPPPSLVRSEEFLNYFDYNYAPPTDDKPFAVHTEVGAAPWEPTHRLVKIGLKAKEIAPQQRAASNLVFLIDTSGSMWDEDKLPLLKAALTLLIDRLTDSDRIAIVTYAGSAGVALPSTAGSEKEKINTVINHLEAAGSTNGGAGISAAYDIVAANFVEGGINRVILCTDGDFNVGLTGTDELVELVRKKAENRLFLTALGFGRYSNDAMLETLADRGNGNYAHVDRLSEGRKVLVAQVEGTLAVVAKDVKIQVEFDADTVKAYRLLGYDNRALNNEDFTDDKKDAGEIGAGHRVTAFFEVVLQDEAAAGNGAKLLNLKLRYKDINDTNSKEQMQDVSDGGPISPDFQFAAAVAEFAMILADSPYRAKSSFEDVLTRARENLGTDLLGYRAGFLDVVNAATNISSNTR